MIGIRILVLFLLAAGCLGKRDWDNIFECFGDIDELLDDEENALYKMADNEQGDELIRSAGSKQGGSGSFIDVLVNLAGTLNNLTGSLNNLINFIPNVNQPGSSTAAPNTTSLTKPAPMQNILARLLEKM